MEPTQSIPETHPAEETSKQPSTVFVAAFKRARL